MSFVLGPSGPDLGPGPELDNLMPIVVSFPKRTTKYNHKICGCSGLESWRKTARSKCLKIFISSQFIVHKFYTLLISTVNVNFTKFVKIKMNSRKRIFSFKSQINQSRFYTFLGASAYSWANCISPIDYDSTALTINCSTVQGT